MHAEACMEFHVSRAARDRYQFDQSLFSIRGTVVFANFQAARVFAQQINEDRALRDMPPVSAGQVNAMALLHEMLHAAFRHYLTRQNPTALSKALRTLVETHGADAVDQTLLTFAEEFPTTEVYQERIDPATYLEGETDGMPNREVVLEEMMLLSLGAANPAYAVLGELFDAPRLTGETAYPVLMDAVYNFFGGEPATEHEEPNIIDLLRRPSRAAPYDLEEQLRYIQRNWGFVGDLSLVRVLSSLDLIREETKPRFTGPGPTEVLRFGGLGFPGGDGGDGGGFGFGPDDGVPDFDVYAAPERFSPDRDWMPELVMIAKSTYVWLDQLAKSYGQPIHRLDDIPDQELDLLQRRGFTGLWLIGLWERSKASQTIKRLCGNPEAVASAYSLYDYQIADDLGGVAAYESLRDRAMARGIRLASDMVPNHMGIDSRWVVEHPDWFVAVPQSPFPSYSFHGPNLSSDGRVSIYLEDHYYSQTDAAVVFQRVDHTSGNVSYIYHGNDGTALPWNDTAQLNYLNPAVREAVIQTILHVARQFSVIRFDAAMTLAKRHYQRLWYPIPGTGGDIASRADHAMSKSQFDAHMPEEFWREVVDRVAQEAPNTLLLAEAFWMMESYFVRTLGMHRVYNSAFMHQLKDEENQKYRESIKNTLLFDPEILKRFVNFVNNPDERTAAEQFGKGDKYFGVCLLMSTLPGLPMFGHGQIEGFAEKYGMEYRRAYYDETPDTYLIERHRREIFPLLHQRYLFANVDQFRLYDVVDEYGMVQEDVFAYSNGLGAERALVIYHNKFGTARGRITISAPRSLKVDGSDQRIVVQSTVGEDLGLRSDRTSFVIYRDRIAGLEYLHNSKMVRERGLFVELEAFKYQVWMDFRQVEDTTGSYAQLAASLQGRGVPSVADALRELELQPIHRPFREFANAGMWQWFMENRAFDLDAPPALDPLDQAKTKMIHLLEAITQVTGATGAVEPVARDVHDLLDVMLCMPVLNQRLDVAESTEDDAAVQFFTSQLTEDPAIWGTLWGWLSVYALGRIADPAAAAAQSRAWIDEWMLDRVLQQDLRNFGVDDDKARRAVKLIQILTTQQEWYRRHQNNGAGDAQPLATLLNDADVQQYIGMNRFDDVVYFNKESWEELLWWLFVIAVIGPTTDPRDPADDVDTAVVHLHTLLEGWRHAAAQAGYQAEKLQELVIETIK